MESSLVFLLWLIFSLVRENAKSYTTSPTDAHPVPAVRVRCAVFDVRSLPRGKERTKKTRQRLPPLETAPVPLFKVGWGEKQYLPQCISRREDTTSGRRRTQNFAGTGVLDCPCKGNSHIVERMGRGPHELAVAIVGIGTDRPEGRSLQKIEEVARPSGCYLWEEFCKAKFFWSGQAEHSTSNKYYARSVLEGSLRGTSFKKFPSTFSITL